jgi:acetyltransferase
MERFLEPRSVVLIGVSSRSGIGAYNNLEMMKRYGFPGRIHVVHPKVEEILGHRIFRSVLDLPEIPDVAVISVGRDRVPAVFDQCVRKGIRRVVVISQGFADADAEGASLQREIVRKAKEHGVRILGPNTLGILNAFYGFSTAFIDFPPDPAPPRLSLIAQTGVLLGGNESFTGRLGKAVDIGNAADVDAVDLLEYFETDPETEIIAVHMEGISRGRTFLETASRVALRKPVIVFKTGRSVAGARAALSHTGSLVGEDAIFEAAFADAGLLRVRNMVEMLAVCRAFTRFRSIAGPRLAVATATGASGIMTADACEDYGLLLAPFPEESREVLENPKIAWHRLNNPVDLWPLGMVSGSFAAVLEKGASALLRSPDVDALLIIAPVKTSPLHEDLRLDQPLQAIVAQNPEKKPVAVWPYGDGASAAMDRLKGMEGVAFYRNIDEAVMGLSGLWRYQQIRQRLMESGPLAFPRPAEDRPVAGLREGVLLGTDAQALLEAYGLPIVSGSLVQSADEAVQWAGGHGYPVVLKVISPQWVHKSDEGGVAVEIGNAQELRVRFEELLRRFREKVPQGTLAGVLVQKQVSGRELLLGVTRDPQFGPVVVVGMGGIYTEVFRDTSRALAPVSEAKAGAMLRSLKLFPILEGVRGESGVDLAAVARAVASLSRLAFDYPEIRELDLNPVFATKDGCWCVDWRIVAAPAR